MEIFQTVGYKLQMFGVLVDGSDNVLYYNEAV